MDFFETLEESRSRGVREPKRKMRKKVGRLDSRQDDQKNSFVYKRLVMCVSLARNVWNPSASDTFSDMFQHHNPKEGRHDNLN
jgi:hypothetical protein